VESLPGNLGEAVAVMERSAFVREALGEHIFKQLVTAKANEWHEHIAMVYPWEVDPYLATY